MRAVLTSRLVLVPAMKKRERLALWKQLFRGTAPPQIRRGLVFSMPLTLLDHPSLTVQSKQPEVRCCLGDKSLDKSLDLTLHANRVSMSLTVAGDQHAPRIM